MSSFNKKVCEEIESKTVSEDRPLLIKTKHEDEIKGRSSLEIPNSDLEEKSVTAVEMRRLEQINGRSTRLVFKGIWELPPVKEILNLDPDVIAVVEAKNGAPSCFCIFTDAKKKVVAEQKLNGTRFRRGNIEVDKHRKMVPVDPGDLDGSREPLTLAVHGLARDVTAHDLKKVFPAAQKISIARRGGSAFLKYSDQSRALTTFQKAEDISVRGNRVQVLFSHFIDGNRSKTNGSSKKESSAISSQLSTQSEKTPVKMDIKSLKVILDGVGLKMDKLQEEYIRGGCEPGSGPDIRMAWMDQIKTKSRNTLSRSSRLDLVDDAWNFFDKDEDTQKRLKMEMENSGKNKIEGLTPETLEKPSRRMLDDAVHQEIEKRESEGSWECAWMSLALIKGGASPLKQTNSIGKKRYIDVDYPCVGVYKCSPERNRRKTRESSSSSSPERNRRKTRESSASSSPARKKGYREAIPGKMHSGRENKGKTSSHSSPFRSDIKMLSLRHWKPKIEYDSSSPSPPPEGNKTRRDVSEGGKLEKQEKKAKQASKSDLNHNQDKSHGEEVRKVSSKSFMTKINQKEGSMDKEGTSQALKTTDEESSFQRILEVKEGFTRMALVMAWRLGYNCDMGQEKRKAMALAMVEVWTNYGFSYSELKDMYTTEKERDPDDGSEEVSFLEMRKLLHKRLRKKVEDGHAKPRKFNFSMLIDLTMFYFEKAT